MAQLLRLLVILVVGIIGGYPASASGQVAIPDANPRAFADQVEEDRVGTVRDEPLSLRPTYLFQGSFDPEMIRQNLGRPDLVILNGDDFERLRRLAETPPRTVQVMPPAVIEAVEVKGEVRDGRASLEIHYSIVLNTAGAFWIPIRLDGNTLLAAREASLDLPVRVDPSAAEPSSGWQVEISGEGRHHVIVAVLVAIRSDNTRQILELPIPRAVSTSLSLEIPPDVSDPTLGPGEPIPLNPDGGSSSGRKRIAAEGLTPREILSISWNLASDAVIHEPPILTARGDLVIEVSRGILLTRSSWSIQALRGTARALGVLLEDRSDELLSVELDDRRIPIDDVFDPSTGHLTLELPEPLRPDLPSRRLVLTMRRTLPTEMSSRFQFRGLRIQNAVEESGLIAVVQGDDLWVTATAGRGLRQVNPLTDLPESLRTRPKIVLAYRFIEQPFDLRIRSDPAPPTSLVEVRTNLVVSPGTIRNATELDCKVTRGRLQEIRLGLPNGLEVVEVGPESHVDSYQILDEEATDTESPAGRVLTVRLKERSVAPGGSVRLALSGRQSISPSEHVRAGLFQPQGSIARSVRVAVRSSRDVAVGLADLGVGARFFHSDGQIPADWPRVPEPVAAVLPTDLWLWTDLNPPELALKVSLRTLDFLQETHALVEIDRHRLDLRQETTCRVRGGILSELDVIVSPSLEGRWEIDGDEVASRQRISVEADGASRYRLILTRGFIDLVRLRFLARSPLPAKLASDQPTRIDLDWIRVIGGESSPTRLEIAAEPGIVLAPNGSSWFPASESLLTPQSREAPAAIRLVWVEPEVGSTNHPKIDATAPTPVNLPSLVASKLWIRTDQSQDGDQQTSAWYRVESHQGSFECALPPGAKLLRALVGLDPVEPEEFAEGIRLPIPTELSGPLLVRLDYRVSTRENEGWEPPRLLKGGVIQDTIWEVYIPWSRAVVGVPSGWIDGNRWYWGGYVWKRRPGLTDEDLARWIGGLNVRGRVEMPDRTERPSGYHGYMFERVGDPVPLDPMVISRAGLVAIVSGSVLAVGLFLLVIGPLLRLASLVACASLVSFSAAVWLDVTLLAVQASAVGILLSILAALTKRLVEMRRFARGLYGEASQLSGMAASTPDIESGGSSRNARRPELGSDESTVVRRHPSTVDYVPVSSRDLSSDSSRDSGESLN